MNHDIRNTCGKRRGCFVTALPYDSQLITIFSRVHGTRNDISKILSFSCISLDKKLEEGRQMEKTSA